MKRRNKNRLTFRILSIKKANQFSSSPFDRELQRGVIVPIVPSYVASPFVLLDTRQQYLVRFRCQTSDARAHSVPKITALKGVRINPIHTKLQWVMCTASYMGHKSVSNSESWVWKTGNVRNNTPAFIRKKPALSTYHQKCSSNFLK